MMLISIKDQFTMSVNAESEDEAWDVLANILGEYAVDSIIHDPTYHCQYSSFPFLN